MRRTSRQQARRTPHAPGLLFCGIAALLAACAAALPAGAGVLEVQVDPGSGIWGGNTPRASAPATPQLAGWRIEVLTPAGAAVASTTTDGDGLARFTLPAGGYLLRQLAPPGFAAAQAVSVTAGAATHTLLHLHPPTP